MKKILICDDDEGVVEVMKIILEENKYQVKTLLKGKGIEKKIIEYLPDLIFLDIWMPGIDGKEITKKLKSDPKFKKIPIVLVSALNDIDKIREKVGADDYLAKPFDITDLIKIVQKHTS